jgi:hypothetical protein
MSKFIHALVIERTEYDDTDRDDAGQPTPQTPTTTDVRGLVQPRSLPNSAREVEDYRSAGSEIADHLIFLPIGTDIRHADAVLWQARRYTVTGIRRFEFGGLAHLEVDAQLVTVTPPLAVGS